MGTLRTVDRRRFLRIAASAGVAALLPGARPALASSWYRWSGEAMGALAGIDLFIDDGASAAALVRRCAGALERLEQLFSLHRPDSAVSLLNRDGVLRDPPPDFVRLLRYCRAVHAATGGAFDITVQPLWELYSGHFSRRPRPSAGPARARIEAAQALVGMAKLHIGEHAVHFAQPGMKITLNGVAQGFATDAVARILRAAGLRHLLVDIGEISAQGHDREGRPWRVDLLDPLSPFAIAGRVALSDRAIASSGGYGLVFDDSGSHHHLFDPATGRSARHNRAVSVAAADALAADALSTAFSAMPEAAIARTLVRFAGAGALVTRNDGSTVTLGAFPALHRADDGPLQQ